LTENKKQQHSKRRSQQAIKYVVTKKQLTSEASPESRQ